MNIYFAQVMDNKAYLEHSLRVLHALEAAGHKVYYPWRDEGVILEDETTAEQQRKTFEADCSALAKADKVIGYIDGLGPDSGTCVELGIAYALHKPIALYTTEFKYMPKGMDLKEVFKPYREVTFAGEGSSRISVEPMINNMLIGVSNGTVLTDIQQVVEWCSGGKQNGSSKS